MGWLVAVLLLAAPSSAHAAGAWRSYLRPTTISAALAEADTLWCVSRDAGLVQYRPSTHAFKSYVREPNGLASNRLSSVALDRSRRMWLGTYGSGASVLSSNRESWALVNVFDGLPSDSVNALTAEGDSMWIATTRGIAVWDGHDIGGVLPDGVNPSPFASDNISGLVRRGDTVWVATRAGVYRSLLSQGLTRWATQNIGLNSLAIDELVSDGQTLFARANFAAYRYDGPQARWTLAGGVGAVFTVGTAHGAVFLNSSTGLFRWSGSGWSLLDATLAGASSSPLVATADAAGQLYAIGRISSVVSAGGAGVYVRPAGGVGSWTFDLPPGPPGNSCLNVDIEGNRVYVTTYDTGIGRLQAESAWKYWYPPVSTHLGTDDFFRPTFPFAMLIDKTSNKWFTCWAPVKFTSTCVPDTGVIDILRDGPGGESVGHMLLGKAPEAARWSFGRASTADSAGGKWFGLDSPCADQGDLNPAGLLYFKTLPGIIPANDTAFVANYNSGNGTSLPSNLVLSLTTDRTGRVWAGTPQGLCNFMPDSLPGQPPVIHTVSPPPVTSSFSVRGLATRRDTLWVFAGSGLYQYSINAGYRGSYDIPSGPSLQAVRPVDVGRDGTLWLGTANGLRAYRPSRDKEDYTTANSPLADDDVRSVRVDPLTGYVWVATAGGLSRFDPGFVAAAQQLPSLTMSVYPNPARLSALGVPIRIKGNGTTYDGTVYDLNGRSVSRFSVRGNGRAVWDGRDPHGDLVQPGIYFLRAESGGRSAVVRVVLLR